MRHNGKIGVPHYNRNGYAWVCATGHPLATPRASTVPLHRVVLYDVIGEGPHPCGGCGRPINWRWPFPAKLVVDHLDGNPSNNSPSNLEAVCQSCNSRRGLKLPITPWTEAA